MGREEMTIDQIKPYDKNAKKHPDKQLQMIAESIKRFGWQQPIKIGSDNIIIIGHGRWFAWKKYGSEKGLKDPWIVDENGKTIHGEAETRKLTEQEEKAYRLADNKLNESDWDMELALEDLKNIDKDLFDLTGFDSDLLITQEERDDYVPEVPEEPKSKYGEVYQLGRHRVMCGDSTKKDDVEKLMDGKKADMVFTDPPYNIAYKGQGKNTSNEIIGDDVMSDAFDIFLTKVFANFRESTKAGGGKLCVPCLAHLRSI